MGHGCSHLQPRSTKIRIYAEDVSDFTQHASMVGVGPLMMEALPSGQDEQEELAITKVSSKSSSCSSLNMEGPEDSPPAKITAAEKIKSKEIKGRPIKERDKRKEPPSAKEEPPRRTASRSEEPSSTQQSRGRSSSSPGTGADRVSAGVETVDRGVGPTPLPPPVPPDPRLATYFGIPPYPDPRNGLEQTQLPYPYGSPYIPFGINVPIPVTSQTHEGRYQWPPSMGLPSPSHGLPTNPTYSDLYGMAGRSLSAGAERLTDFATRIQWEQLQQYRQMISPSSLAAAAAAASHRGFSPTRGFSPVLSGFGSLLPQPAPGSALSHRSMFSEHPAPPSGSVTLPGSLESSRLTSPRPSIIGKGGRKRALSHSPFSDCGYLDIESLTRSSGGSLQLPFPPGNSRSSSATSGSYGHLSAGMLASSFGGSPLAHGTPTHPLLRHPGLPTSPFMPHMVHPHMLGRQPMGLPPSLTPVQPMVQPLGASKHESFNPSPHHASSTTARDPGSSVVSSTVEHSDAKKTRVKREEPDSPGSSDGKSSGPRSVDPQRPPQEGEPDFIETNCHWKGCSREYETQDELVRHINQDHIQSNKKAFICQWTDCSREEKPFKAQYMLVVHMRRHTGEKPHRCTFEGCYKAYSRLENLKTHLRSHTGEKPYMCEFPGCTKAFSNASDRAKHQNRTHSNAKPYVCKAPNCNKRYTDPSSLRKHVKTVHGPDFYANKKHKGDPGGPHNGGDRKGSDKRSGGDDQHPGGGGAGECGPRSVTTIKTEGGDSNDGFGTSGEQPRQNQSSSENGHSDNSPLSNPSDIAEGEDSNPVPSGPLGVSEMMGGDEDDPEYNSDEDGEDILLPATTGGVATAHRARCIQPGRLNNRLNAKAAITGLPPIGNSQRRQDSMSKSKHSPPHRRTITDLISQGSQESGIYLGSLRRDSNTSTLSSFISSGRSESSPFPGNHSNEVGTGGSNSRLSVSNSPYEYDIPSRHSRRSSESSNISHVAAQLEKARLGSQGSLNTTPLPPLRPPSTSSRSSMEPPVKGTLRCAVEDGWRIGTTSSTPTRTPVPSEMPSNRVRRASDPIQCEEARQLQQRFSLSKPLTITKSSRSLDKPPSSCGRASNFHCGSNFRSSCSSIATDYDQHEGHYMGNQEVNNMSENDLLITDEMQRFLNEQYQQTIQRQQADSTVQDCGASPRHVTPAPTQMYSRVSSRSSVNVPPSPQGPMASPAHAASPSNPMAMQMSPGHMMSPGGMMQQPQPMIGQMNSPGHMASPAHMMSPRSMSSPGQMGAGPQGQMASPGQQMGQMAGPQMASSPWPQQQQHQHRQQGGSTKMDRSQCNPCQNPYNNMSHPTSGPHPHMPEMMSPGQQQHQFNPQHQQQQFYNMQQHQNFPQQHPQMAMQQDMPQQGQFGPYPAQHYEMYNQWRGQQGEGMPGYGGGANSMYGGYNMQGPMNGMQKSERNSPMIQVPQVSQSQQQNMKRRCGYPQQHQQHQQPMMVDQFNQIQYPYQQQQQQQSFNNQYGGYGGLPVQQQQGAQGPQHHQNQQQMHPQQFAQQNMQQNMQGHNGVMMNQPMQNLTPQGPGGPQVPNGPHARNMYNQGDMNDRGNNNRPICPPQGGPLGVQMSPGHNQVSSTTDVKECQTDMESALEENMHTVSTDNILDNLSSISMEHIPGQVMLSPTQLAMTRSASQASSRMNTGTPYTDGKMSQASYLDTSNMVVNDMSSVLTQLAEENRYLNLR